MPVPTNDISIGTNLANGDRQLQFTHVTWDAGTGPFETDPTYNATTGISSFTQAIYNSPSPGVWLFDHSVPLAVDRRRLGLCCCPVASGRVGKSRPVAGHVTPPRLSTRGTSPRLNSSVTVAESRRTCRRYRGHDCQGHRT